MTAVEPDITALRGPTNLVSQPKWKRTNTCSRQEWFASGAPKAMDHFLTRYLDGEE